MENENILGIFNIYFKDFDEIYTKYGITNQIFQFSQINKKIYFSSFPITITNNDNNWRCDYHTNHELKDVKGELILSKLKEKFFFFDKFGLIYDIIESSIVINYLKKSNIKYKLKEDGIIKIISTFLYINHTYYDDDEIGYKIEKIL